MQSSGASRGQKSTTIGGSRNVSERGQGSVFSGHGATQCLPAKRRHEEDVVTVSEEEEIAAPGLHAFSTARDEYVSFFFFFNLKQ